MFREKERKNIPRGGKPGLSSIILKTLVACLEKKKKRKKKERKKERGKEEKPKNPTQRFLHSVCFQQPFIFAPNPRSMEVGGARYSDRDIAMNEKAVRRKSMFVLLAVNISVCSCFFNSRPVQLFPELRIFAVFATFFMSLLLFILGVLQPWTRFSKVTVTMLVLLDLMLLLLAVGLPAVGLRDIA